MTIDEIVSAERDNAEFSKANNYDKSADYHNQIAECLEELKAYRENSNGYNKEDIELNRNAVYNKAIDDFVIAIICELKNKHTDMPIVDIFGNREKWREKNSQYLEFENLAYKIAEQLKAGRKNE